MTERIMLTHGGGGSMMDRLITDLFIRCFDHPVLRERADAAVLSASGRFLAFTTDSYVVDPVFFPGGDIGKLAVCGTLNDLAVTGARPAYMTAAFIIEEGLPFEDLEKIVLSMADEAKRNNVSIVAGDTKVVPKGKCDKLFINTSGIGFIDGPFLDIRTGIKIRPGDRVIVNGTLGNHGMAILTAREQTTFHAPVRSDCASLLPLISGVLKTEPDVRFMRDATRGGFATVLCEITRNKSFGIEIFEKDLPVAPVVNDLCNILGMDPLYIANEGRAVFIVPPEGTQRVIQSMNEDENGKEASIVGIISSEYPGQVVMHTRSGGKRTLDYRTGDMVPRIC